MGWWWCNHCFKHTIEQHPCKLNRSFHRNMPPSLFLISYLRYIVSLPHTVTVLGTEKKRAAFVKISRKRWQEGRGRAQHHSDESRSRKAHAIDPISGATLVHSLPLRPLHRQITRQLYFFFSSLRQVFSSNASTLKRKALKFLLQIDLGCQPIHPWSLLFTTRSYVLLLACRECTAGRGAGSVARSRGRAIGQRACRVEACACAKLGPGS